ncbi:MAG: hypothetical protein ABI851_07970 [Saprospiraceae bacterium]
MRNLIWAIFILNLCITACKTSIDPNFNTDNEYKEQDYKSLFDRERYMLPTPEGVYVPQNLTKLSFLETMEFGNNKPTAITNLSFKDSKGVPVPWDSIATSRIQLFTQLYKNDSGRVVEAVCFEMTDEFKKMIKKGYLPTNSDPKSSSTSTSNLRDRFMIPTFENTYVPKNLRKLSLLEMLEYGESGRINTPFIKKNFKGEKVGEDYFTSGPGLRYMQGFVDKNGDIKEAVIYEMTDEIHAIFTLMRFVK